MAKGLKYRIFYSDELNQEYRVGLYYEGYASSPIELEGSSNDITVSYEDSDNIFNPVNGSGCSFGFYNNGSLVAADFFTVGLYDIEVKVEQKNSSGTWGLVWGGYVNPEVYEEDYTWSEGVIQLSANDGLATAKRDKFFSGADVDGDGLVIEPWKLGVDTVGNVLAKCLSSGFFTRIYTVVDTQPTNGTWADMSVDLSNYVDEDKESMTKREVLESILTPCTLRVYIFGNACWIIDPTVLALSSSTTPFKAYDSSFIAVPAEDGIYDKIFDISNSDLRFFGGNQSMSTNGGYKTMISNYSAYPSKQKVIPFQPSEIEFKAGSWQPLSGYIGGGSDLQYTTRFDYTGLYDEYSVDLSSRGGMLGYADVSDGVVPSDDSYGTKYFSIADASGFQNEIIVGEDTPVSINGGWIPASDNEVLIRFKVRVNPQIWGSNINKMSIPISITVGGTDITYSQSGLAFDYNNTLLRREITVEARFTTNSSFGQLKIEFDRGIKLWNWNGTIYSDDTEDFGSFSQYVGEFEVYINSTEVNDEDLEYKTESGIDYISKETIDINNSSRRINGVLDRGAFINLNGGHETYFSRDSFPQSGSIGLTMAKAYLGNYENTHRTLNASIFTDKDMLGNLKDASGFATYPESIDEVFTPISVIKDSNFLGSSMFLMNGCEINILRKEAVGSWSEIRDANYIITEEA